jgi:hypothetical protein
MLECPLLIQQTACASLLIVSIVRELGWLHFVEACRDKILPTVMIYDDWQP